MPVTWRHHRHPIPAPTPVIVTRRYTPGHYVALSDSQMGTQPGKYGPSGIPNPGKRWDTGPVATGVKALMVRYHWNELDNGDGTYNWARPDAEIAQCAAFPKDVDNVAGVQLFMLIVTRTFTGYNLAVPFALSNVHTTGTAGQFSCNAASTTLQGLTGSPASANMVVYITGTNTGSGSITGYPASRRYVITATNGSTTFTLQTLDQNPIVTAAGTLTGLSFSVLDVENPVPPDLQFPTMYVETFTSGLNPGGWQTWRWSPTVLARFDTFVKAIGARYDSNAFFGGIATQETATGSSVSGGTGDDAYTSANYVAGLKAESNSIGNALDNGRPMHYTNFIAGPYTAPLTSESQCLDAVAAVAQPNGAVWGGPDLVVGGSILTRCYPTYNKFHNATSPVLKSGPTFCCVQSAEWTDQAPANAYPGTTMQDRYDFGTGVKKNYGGGPITPPLNLDVIVWDWHTNGSPQFNSDGTAIFAANPAPFGTWTP